MRCALISGVSTDEQTPETTSPAPIARSPFGVTAFAPPAFGAPRPGGSVYTTFGCVLDEMLTGTQAFRGATVSETLADVLKSEPPWTALPPETRTKLRARPKLKASEGA